MTLTFRTLTELRKMPSSLVAKSACVKRAASWANDKLTKLLKETLTTKNVDDFEAFAERIPVGVYRTTLDGKILFVNQALVEMLGFPNKEALMKINAESGYVEPEERQYFLSRVQEKNIVRSMEATWKRLDGEQIDVLDSCRLVRDGKGEVVLEGVVEDITKLKQAQKIADSQSRLAMIGSIAASVAHEWNNVSSGFLGYLSLAESEIASLHKGLENRNSELAFAAEEIKINLRKAEEFFRQTLNLPRTILDLGRENTQKSEFSPNDAICVAKAMVVKQFQGKCVELKIDLEESIPELFGKKQDLVHVVLNLLTNALYATPQEGKVAVTSRKESEGVVIEISDTGHGIPDEIRDKIFEPFYTTKCESDGTGLGLSAVRGWVEGMGGEITFRSQVGEGTTFLLFFPVSNRAG